MIQKQPGKESRLYELQEARKRLSKQRETEMVISRRTIQAEERQHKRQMEWLDRKLAEVEQQISDLKGSV